MSKLELSKFAYVDKPTVTVEGRRFYELAEDKAYPSITTVLSGSSDESDDWLQKWHERVGKEEAERISKAATTRGTNMHLMLERYMRDEDPKLDEFPPDHVKLFKSLKPELRKVNKVYGQEVVLYSDKLEVAGRCDMVAEYNNEIAIVDYKSSSRRKTADTIHDYWVQATFYATAHNEMFGTDIKRLVIMMGVDNGLPMVFKRNIDDMLLTQLRQRTTKFYTNFLATI